MADRLDKVREAAGALCDYLDETSGGAEWKGAPLVRRLRAALDATLAAPTDKVREAAERWASSEVDAYPGRTLEDRIKSWMAGGVHPDDVEWFLIDAYEAGYRAALAAPSGGDATPRDEAVVKAVRDMLAQCTYSVGPDGTELVVPYHVSEFNRAMLVLRGLVALVPQKGGAR